MQPKLVLFAFCALPLGPAHAATVNIVSTSIYNAPDPADDVLDQIIQNDIDTVGNDSFYQTGTSASGEGASASSSGSVDIETGLLRSRTETDLSAPTSGTGIEASGNTQVSLDLGFTATGSGNITVQLAVDGFWDLSREDGATQWQAQGSLSLGSSQFDSFGLGATDPSAGIFDDILEISFNVQDGEEYTIHTSLFTQILAGTEGVVDFSNTAALSFFTDPSVQLAFDDPRALTIDPSTSTIPLPAGVWGLLAALGSFAALRRRRNPG